MIVSNKTYDILKFIALTLPFVTTFVAAIMKIWNLPYATEITLTLAAINTLIAELVKVLSNNYKKEKMNK